MDNKLRLVCSILLDEFGDDVEQAVIDAKEQAVFCGEDIMSDDSEDVHFFNDLTMDEQLMVTDGQRNHTKAARWLGYSAPC